MILSSFLDLFFPPVCPLCEKAVVARSFCAACERAFEASRIKGPVCTVCGTPFASASAQAHACGQCIKEPPPFVQAVSAYLYEGAVLSAVSAFKFNARVSLAAGLGALSAEAARFDAAPQLVLPVPLHVARLRRRGFNQSLLLAQEVASTLSLPIDYTLLSRVRETASQTGLKAADRRINVKGAFAVARPDNVKGRRVLLVDDVMTTGSTVRECAAVLKSAGASVSVLTLARAVRL
ncbi:MAG: ComF family protein [Deltaproteobacteria bacterium]|nr:ComF family protein [Deltaproteobacteria bacterium]